MGKFIAYMAILVFAGMALNSTVVDSKSVETVAAEPSAEPVEVPRISSIFEPSVQYWNDKIQFWAGAVGIDPNLLATLMQIESCGDPNAQSYAGATGLFQVMPFHFENSENPYDIETNALRGLNYLKRSYETAAGDISLALAGYNGGISVINQPTTSWADETIRYVYWGSGIYQEASQGNGNSQRLAEWLTNGGASLCRQAAVNLGLNP